MEYLAISFIAGMLTILAPCVLPLLPITLGGSLTGPRDRYRPAVIVISLAVSIVVFTLLLKASTLLIMVDPRIWNVVSGVIILFFGLITLFPGIWEAIAFRLSLSSKSGELLQSSSRTKGTLGAILIGAALGPVFTSCSPTYTLIVAIILPQSFFAGLLNLFAYALGITLIFGAIALGGQRLLSKIRWVANPNGIFKKILGVMFVILGIAIITGLEKQLESALLDAGFGNQLIQIENQLKQP